MSVSDLPYPHFVPYHHPHHHHHHHHPHHRYSFSNGQNFPLSSSPAPYQVPPLYSSLSAIAHDVSQAPRNSSLNHSRINPAFTTMNTLSTEEMERFQKLSNEFEADVQVWRKQSYPVLRGLLCIIPADFATVIGPARVDKAIDPGNCSGILQCGSDLGYQDWCMEFLSRCVYLLAIS